MSITIDGQKGTIKLEGSPTADGGIGYNATNVQVQEGGTDIAPTTLTGSDFPAGTCIPYGGTTAPTGWVLCDGTSYSKTAESGKYAALHTAIGYTFGGSGDNFSVPSFRGRFVAGKDNMNSQDAGRLSSIVNGDSLAATGGGQTVTLDSSNMRAHTHPYTGNAGSAARAHDYDGNYTYDANTGSTSSSYGSSGAHNNTPPVLIIGSWIIKL